MSSSCTTAAAGADAAPLSPCASGMFPAGAVGIDRHRLQPHIPIDAADSHPVQVCTLSTAAVDAGHGVNQTLRAFRFKVCLPQVVRAARGLDESITFNLYLTQSEFDDDIVKRERVRAALRDIGIHDADRPYWYGAPLVDPALLARLHRALEADERTILDPRYAHAWHHDGYRTLVLDGRLWRWQVFDSVGIIKIAPQVGQWPWPLALANADPALATWGPGRVAPRVPVRSAVFT